MRLWAKKGLVSNAKKELSADQAITLKRAILDIENSSIDSLVKSGKAKKLNVRKAKNVYVYRARNARVVFSPEEQGNVVHDIVDTRNGMSLASKVKVF